MRFSGLKTTTVRPAAYAVDNLGSTVKMLTFTYNGVGQTINRQGKANIVIYTSFKRRTVTIKSGKTVFKSMSVDGFDFLSLVYTDGTIESNDYTGR